MQQKVWVYRDINGSEVDRLASEAGISRLLAKVFISRGVLDCKFVKSFLHPDIEQLYDPFLMDGMAGAVERIVQAVDGHEQILIFGDYDVDGVVSTSILYNYLSSRGANVQYYLPDRMEDGYGLTMGAAEKVELLKVSLVITVDCGITSAEEVRYLTERGMQVIVTDHHECKEVLPDAFAVLNPHKPGCGYPFKELAGAGVVLKLIQALSNRSGCAGSYRSYLDLAALATIADIVPLIDENRIIASFGLKAMETTANQGLNALIKVSGLGGKPISAYSAAYGLAPRVNAAGRIGSAVRGVRLFTADSQVFAEAMAKELDDENKIRQGTESEILEETLKFIEADLDPEHGKVLVIGGEGWHQGVIGIVASKVLEKYNRPVIMLSIEDGIAKGSGRSLKCFNLFKALCFCEDLLDRFGGHEMAAGLTIKSCKINEFRKRINAYADSILTDVDLLPCIRVDAFLDRADMTLQNVYELARLAPFGAGNPGAVFGYAGFTISGIRTLSAGKHIRLGLSDGSLSAEGIGFNMGELAGAYKTGDAIDAVFTLEVNSWNGTDRLQMNLRDMKSCIYTYLDKNIVFNRANDYNEYNKYIEEICRLEGRFGARIAELIPRRDDLEAVYRFLRAYGKEKKLKFEDLFILSAKISEKYRVNINYFKLKKCLEIFEELGLLTLEPIGQGGAAVMLAAGVQKMSLEVSRLFRQLQSLGRDSLHCSE